MREEQVRSLAAGLGIVTVAFGVVPLLAPRLFARVFGFAAPDAANASMMRSLGVRDTVMGMGLWSAAAHGGKFAPWLLARTLTDGGDTLAVAAAIGSGQRNRRFGALGLLALGAALGDAALYFAARQASKQASQNELRTPHQTGRGEFTPTQLSPAPPSPLGKGAGGLGCPPGANAVE